MTWRNFFRSRSVAMLAAALLAIVAASAGYACHQRTFVSWSEPVLWSLAAGGAVGLALRRPAMRLTALRPWAALAVAISFVAVVAYGLLMSVNYFCASSACASDIKAVVIDKYSEEHTRTRRAARGRAYPAGKYNVYYIRIEFDDGTLRDIQVPAATYAATRRGAVKHFVAESGFFGYKVFKSPKTRDLSK